MHFFDTNVLVYAVDPGEARKRPIAMDVVRQAVRSQSFVISTQVMLEFYATVLRRRLAKPEDAVELLREWAWDAPAATSPDSVWRAFELQQRYRFSVWDAMMVQSAIDSHCGILYTEDLQNGQMIGALRVVNPFTPAGVHEPQPSYGAGTYEIYTPRRRKEFDAAESELSTQLKKRTRLATRKLAR